MLLMTIDSSKGQVTSVQQPFRFLVRLRYVIMILTSPVITALAYALHRLSIAFSEGFPLPKTEVLLPFL